MNEKKVHDVISVKHELPRTCSVTGKGMNEGFYFERTDFYCISEEHALEHAKELGYTSLEESFNDEAHYWTQWEEDDIHPLFV